MKNRRFNPFATNTPKKPDPEPTPQPTAPAPKPDTPSNTRGQGSRPPRQRRKRTPKDAQAALDRIRNNPSTANHAPTIAAFVARGIPASEISPKENVLTFDAWPALGRHVRKGEKGVTISAWRVITSKTETDEKGQPKVVGRRPVKSTLFHISQTEPNEPTNTNTNTESGIPSWL